MAWYFPDGTRYKPVDGVEAPGDTKPGEPIRGEGFPLVIQDGRPVPIPQ